MLLQEGDSEGIVHIELGAKEGHSLSLIALGVLHLDGSEQYLSCELGVQSLKTALNRGNIAASVRVAHQQSGLSQLNQLLVLVHMGDPTSALNTALLLENHQGLTIQHLDFSQLEQQLTNDPFQKRTKDYLPHLPDTNQFYFSDYLQLVPLSTLFHIQSQPYLKESINHPIYSLNKLISLYLLTTLQGKDRPAQGHYKIGQYFYYGWGVQQDYQKAKEYFEKAFPQTAKDSSLNQRDHVMCAFYLGYMNQHGLGLNQNVTKQGIYFKRVDSLTHKTFLIPFTYIRHFLHFYYQPSHFNNPFLSIYSYLTDISLQVQKLFILFVLFYLLSFNIILKLRYQNLILGLNQSDQ